MPGAGIDPQGHVVTVKNANFLVPQPVLRRRFRTRFRELLGDLAKEHPLPAIDPAVWSKDWGVHLQSFGSGETIIKYLARYVCRTAIGDSRIVSMTGTHVTFRWKDRANHDALRTGTIPGTEFVKRYLRHVLPSGLRAIRYHGFCHPASKAKRERIAFHTGRPLLLGPVPVPPPKPAPTCSCCGEPTIHLATILPAWRSTPNRAPPVRAYSYP